MNRSRLRFGAMALVTALLFLQLIPSTAQEPAANDPQIPDALKPWREWVLWKDKDRTAPPIYSDANKRVPLWPSLLKLDVQKTGGRFEIAVNAFAETWLPLPGSADRWPVNVVVNDAPVPVVDRAGRPAISLQPGTYRVAGEYRWTDLPQNLVIPTEIGILALTIDGAAVANPRWDASGILWFRRDATAEPTEKPFLSAKVYALLEDGIPLQLQTHVELIVSGKSREEDLGTVIPEGWKISAVESGIPAIVDDAGRMKAQVRAGTWTVVVRAFRADNPTEIKYPTEAKRLVTEELLAFAAKPELRTSEIEGPLLIDASQTTVPDEFRRFPVYQWNTAEPLRIVERLRGMGEQKIPGLEISREWWLDESGRSYTFRDRITGKMQQIWRLDAAPGQAIGAVRAAGEGQLITQNPQSGATGVEVRKREIDLEATGRMDRSVHLSATGWNADADQVGVTLNLPPGWRLLALFGADWVSGDWLTQWTLLDLFLLLIFSLAVFKLHGVAVAAVAFVAFGLSYHEPTAPRFIWLAVLVPLALLRVVPEGRMRTIINWAKWATLGIFVLIAARFVIGQMQQALYPQLEPTRQFVALKSARHADTYRDSVAPVAAAAPAVAGGGTGGIEDKLNRIIIPKLEYRDATLEQAVDMLRQLAIANDPQGVGVPITIVAEPPPSSSTPPAPTPVIPALELPGGAQPPESAASVEPKITVSLSNIPLGEALRYVTGLTNMKFKVTPDGVVIVPMGTPTESVITKEWRVSPGVLVGAPQDQTRGPGVAWRSNVKDYLTAQGVSFPPGASAIYLSGENKLIVRNTEGNLDLIDAIIGATAAPSDASRWSSAAGNLQYDPGARIQTGPGVPSWQWRSVSFGWNGPVQAGQQVRPILIPALLNRVISLVRVLLVALLAAALLEWRPRTPRITPPKLPTAAVILFALLAPLAASAQMPDQRLLDQLRERLLEKSDAFPNAADIPVASVKIEDQRLTIETEIHAAARAAVPLPGRLDPMLPLSVAVDGKPEASIRRQDGYLWVVLETGVHKVRMDGLLPNGTEWVWTFLLKPRQVQVDAPAWNVTGISPSGVPEEQVFFTLKQQATPGEVTYENQNLQTLVRIERQIELGLRWQVRTRAIRVTTANKAVSLRVPLLPGESVLSSNFTVRDGAIEVRLGANQRGAEWESRLEIADNLKLVTRPEDSWIEQWRLVVSPVWNVALTGLPPVFEQTQQALEPTWNPWPGESVELAIARPKAISGATMTVDRVQHSVALGKRQRTSHLDVSLRSSAGEDFLIELPSAAEITSLTLSGQQLPVRKDNARLIVPVRPGEQQIAVDWKSNEPLGFTSRTQAVTLPVESANVATTITVPEDRWVLWTAGPLRGPAVRFWGILISSLLAAFVLGRLRQSPLRTLEWMLLVIGLTQVPLPAALIVVGWLFLLVWRGSEPFQKLARWPYNLAQVFLVGLTAIALGILIWSVGEGLLGSPEMFITGNGSSRTVLQWYQDRISGALTQPLVISVSIWWYRLLMLIWALWLAAALIRWLSWGWGNFSRGGFIRRKPLLPPPPIVAPAPQP